MVTSVVEFPPPPFSPLVHVFTRRRGRRSRSNVVQLGSNVVVAYKKV